MQSILDGLKEQCLKAKESALYPKFENPGVYGTSR